MAGSRPSRSSRPTTLSTALWRPMSSRTSSGAPVAVEGGRRVHRAGARRTGPGPGARRPGTCGEQRRSATARPTGIGAMRSRSSSMAVEPHRPHDDVVAASRGVGAGAVPPVSTLTTLNSLSTALPGAAVAAADAPARRRAARRRGTSPTASSKSWPGVRIVVPTRWSSRRTSSGSSTMRRSGRRRSAWPSQCWVSIVAVRPRVTARGYRAVSRWCPAEAAAGARRSSAACTALHPRVHEHADHGDEQP